MDFFYIYIDDKPISKKVTDDKDLIQLISQGYRNPHIKYEASTRNINIPDRLVDTLSIDEIMCFINEFRKNSNAISDKIIKVLEKQGLDDFLRHLNEYIIKNEIFPDL